MFNRSVTLRGLVLLTGICLFSGAIRAADGPEFVGFAGGATYGGGLGTHGLFGGGGSFRIANNIRLLGEFGYSPIGSASVSGGGVSASASAHLFDFGGGADYSFLSPTSKARPYFVGVVGGEHLTANLSVTGSGISPASASGSLNAVYWGFGGGLRYSIGKGWGIKPEIRYQHSVNTGNTVLFTVGGFFRAGE